MSYLGPRCKKGDGVLVKQILGYRKIKLTSAMEHGKLLEKDVSRTKSTPQNYFNIYFFTILLIVYVYLFIK